MGGAELLTLEALQANRDRLLSYTEAHYGAALVTAALVYALSTALSIPGAVVLSLAMGLLFGRWVGTGLIVISATAGATLVFLAARYLFADAVERRMGPRVRKVAAGFRQDAFQLSAVSAAGPPVSVLAGQPGARSRRARSDLSASHRYRHHPRKLCLRI